MNSKAKTLFWSSLIVSMLIHVLFFGGAQVYSLLRPVKKVNKSQPIEWVEVKDPQPKAKRDETKLHDKLSGQIVEQDQKPVREERPEDAKYLSRYNQKVEKETRAAQHGRFQNKKASAPAPKTRHEATKEQLPQRVADAKRPADQMITTPNGSVPLKNLLPSALPTPPPETIGSESQTNDHLKDVVASGETLLNTREFIYYSYYSRIKERIAQYWEPNIKQKMTNLLRQGRHIASSSDRTTHLLIILDDRGKLVKIQVLGESGVQDLDQAAIDAFQTAAPFPNPPRGMVEGDGTIRIRWAFVIES